MLRLLEDQAQHLRHPNARNQIGYAATALAWRALALGGADEVVTSSLGQAPEAARTTAHSRLDHRTCQPESRIRARPPRRRGVGGGGDGEGLVVSGGGDGAVRLWDPRNPGDPGRELGRHDGAVSAVAVTGDGLVVSGGEDGTVRLWDPRNPG